jgi:hypothetical protein
MQHVNRCNLVAAFEPRTRCKMETVCEDMPRGGDFDCLFDMRPWGVRLFSHVQCTPATHKTGFWF